MTLPTGRQKCPDYWIIFFMFQYFATLTAAKFIDMSLEWAGWYSAHLCRLCLLLHCFGVAQKDVLKVDEIRLRVDGPVFPCSKTTHDLLLWRNSNVSLLLYFWKMSSFDANEILVYLKLLSLQPGLYVFVCRVKVFKYLCELSFKTEKNRTTVRREEIKTCGVLELKVRESLLLFTIIWCTGYFGTWVVQDVWHEIQSGKLWGR